MTLKATIDAVKKAHSAPLPDSLAKAYTQGLGLVAYDLQAPALNLYPVLTPLRNKIPRVMGSGGTATNWKAITGINTTNTRAGVSEGQRGAIITTTLASYVASYKGIGLEDSVSFEADYAAEGFDDAKAKAVYGLLNSVFIQEERIIFGGNASLALGTTATPSVSTSTTGGSLAAATYSVICVALSHVAWREGTIAGGIPVTVTRTNADSTTDTVNGGHAGKSAAASQVTTGATSTISATVAVTNGAVAYAWYWGVSGSELLGAITTINSVLISANAAGTQNASALVGDKSQDALVHDGLLTQIFTPGSNSYNTALATGTAGTGTVLTSDGAGGITQIDTVLKSFWDNYRLGPDMMYVSATTLIGMNKLVIANGGAPLIRYNLDANGSGMGMDAGSVIGSYLNKVLNKKVKVEVHPDCPDGLIVFWSDSVPYPLSGVGNVVQIKQRRSYYQLEWPLRTRKYEYGVYVDQLLQNYFPPAFGVLKNFAVA
jgi:hypothetical protein